MKSFLGVVSLILLIIWLMICATSLFLAIGSIAFHELIETVYKYNTINF